MRCNCPQGWKSVSKLKNITLEDSSVEIHDGICDSADLCGITRCDYYDVTREGTRRYMKALAHSQTLEGLLEEQQRTRPD